MKKIGIINCYNQTKKCPGTGCFDAFNKKEASFKNYDSQYVITGFVHCNGCSKDSAKLVLERAKSMKDAGIEVIHLSTCMQKLCPRYDEHIEILSKEFDIVGYTHD